MDSLLVDLDKVLDDFEAEESLAPGTELKPSGFQEYLEASNEQTWNEIDNVETADNSHENSATDIADKPAANVLYDFPYEPESFDLSEADFAPSSNLGDSGYNGSLALKLNIPSKVVDQGQVNKESVNGDVEKVLIASTAGSGLGQQPNSSASVQSNGNYVKMDRSLSNGTGSSVSKYPVQADNSPISDLAQGAFQLNGHLGEDEKLRDTSDNIDAASVAGSSLASVSPQDADKYPVQCNTPQTPKENPFKNPLEMQLNNSNGTASNNINNPHASSQRTMQDIPKLNNLQKELDSQASVNLIQPLSKQLNKNSYSLPANLFDQTLQNGVKASGNSLPADLIVDEKNIEPDPRNMAVDPKLNMNFHTDSVSVPKWTEEPKVENQIISKEVVGFENIADDVPECDQQKFTGSVMMINNAEVIQPKASLTNEGQTVVDNFSKSDNTVQAFGESEVICDPKDIMGDQIDALEKRSEQIDSEICDADLEVLKLLPAGMTNIPAVNAESVIPSSGTALSPGANVSMDSGCASMTDVGAEVPVADVGARPKDINSGLAIPSSAFAQQNDAWRSDSSATSWQYNNVGCDIQQLGAVALQTEKIEERVDASFTHDSRELMEVDKVNPQTDNSAEFNTEQSQSVSEDIAAYSESSTSGFTADDVMDNDGVDMRLQSEDPYDQDSDRSHSWDSQESGQAHMPKQKRPTSLNLPPQPTFNPSSGLEDEEDQGASGGGDTEGSADGVTDEAMISEGQMAEAQYRTPDEAPPPYSISLGKTAPTWVPDAEAPVCMSCEMKFTFRKRRHHCRACGKVFCSSCCSMKNKLEYLKFQEARVCLQCHKDLANAEALAVPGAGAYSHGNGRDGGAAGQAAGGAAPTVMVPVHGVLKHDGNNTSNVNETGSSRRSEPKQVMFSDGIRPGGDLTELDGRSSITRTPRRSRVQKRVERTGHGGQQSPRSRRLRTVTDRTYKCLIPDDGLPPLSVTPEEGSGQTLASPDPTVFMPKIKDEESPPVIFALNANLFVSVKIVNLDCCVSRVVWCFTTRGMTTVGQEELTIILEYLPEEETIPRDIFVHLNNVFEEASRGTFVTELGHTIFNQSFLGSRDHGGFLYIRATFQCIQKLHVPEAPFLFGILLQKWETPWAKVFPIRLLLRLGAEYRYYPCPLIGVRNRKPVFFEIGHTIMNLLADFRNFQYMLPSIRGITIHMEDKVTKINFPRNRYDELMKVVNNSNEHVMAIAATFSAEADSHLVCIQNDEGSYQTQAINIQNKPRKVTGASFVVFNGALKTSSGLSAKSSIVEDGLMVQITPDSMLALKQSMKDMQSYTILCGVTDTPKPDETVIVQWVDDDKNVNIGVKSPIDSMLMDGIESLKVQNTIDYVGETRVIRWTEIFFIQNRDSGSTRWEPVDLSRLGETLATAFCIALTPNLDKLKELGLTKIGLRVTLGADNVGYESGAKGQRLPDTFMNDLDNELIPVIHRATQQDGSIILELIFQIID